MRSIASANADGGVQKTALGRIGTGKSTPGRSPRAGAFALLRVWEESPRERVRFRIVQPLGTGRRICLGRLGISYLCQVPDGTQQPQVGSMASDRIFSIENP